jgi:hypothetical protein
LVQIRNSFIAFKNFKKSELERIKRRVNFNLNLHDYEKLMLDYLSQPNVTVMKDMEICAQKFLDNSVKLCLTVEDKRCKKIITNFEGRKLYEYNV